MFEREWSKDDSKRDEQDQNNGRNLVKKTIAACVSTVRKHTLEYTVAPFDACLGSDGSIYSLGTEAQRFSFGKCMNDKGLQLGPPVK